MTTKTVLDAAQALPKDFSMKSPEAANPTIVSLEELARDLKISPRDARMLLRLAAKQSKRYPNLGKEHVARQPWQWPAGSKALEEARKALTATV